jgi:hypothetical protein
MFIPKTAEALRVRMPPMRLKTLLQLWDREVPFAESSLKARRGWCQGPSLQLVNIPNGRTTVNGLTGVMPKSVSAEAMCGDFLGTAVIRSVMSCVWNVRRGVTRDREPHAYGLAREDLTDGCGVA